MGSRTRLLVSIHNLALNIITMKNYALQGPFYYVVIQRGSGDGDIVPLLVKMLKTLAGWYLGLASAEHSCGLPSP